MSAFTHPAPQVGQASEDAAGFQDFTRFREWKRDRQNNNDSFNGTSHGQCNRNYDSGISRGMGKKMETGFLQAFLRAV